MRSRRITPIPYQKLVKVFELDGFTVKRRKGDHLIMTKPGVKRPSEIPNPKSLFSSVNTLDRYFEVEEYDGET